MFGGLTSPRGLIGFDYGATGLKILQVREQKGNLEAAAAARVGTSLAELEQLDSGELSRRIQKALAGGSFVGKRCAVSLPRSAVHLQSLRLPIMPDDELRQAVVWEAGQRFGIEVSTALVDFIRTGATVQSSEGREEVVLIAAERPVIDRWLEPLMNAGLRPEAVETSFTSSARFYCRRCRRDADQNIVRVIADVGASGSTVMIVRGDQIAFAKQLNVRGDALNQAVAERLNFGAEDVIAVRAARSLDTESGDPAVERAVYEAVRPILCDLVKEIVLCLRYYGVTFRGHPPNRLILSGGDGPQATLEVLLGESSKIEVATDDDASTLGNLAGQIERSLGDAAGAPAAWASVAGLSLRGLETRRGVKQDEDERSRGAA